MWKLGLSWHYAVQVVQPIKGKVAGEHILAVPGVRQIEGGGGLMRFHGGKFIREYIGRGPHFLGVDLFSSIPPLSSAYIGIRQALPAVQREEKLRKAGQSHRVNFVKRQNARRKHWNIMTLEDAGTSGDAGRC